MLLDDGSNGRLLLSSSTRNELTFVNEWDRLNELSHCDCPQARLWLLLPI
jgi:hypothetical protein